MREAICALKYKGRRPVASQLGALLAGFAPEAAPPGVQAVVPVPLHPLRLTERGFNQAELLARPVAETLHVPCLPTALRRVGKEPQAGLDASARRQNVRQAFQPGRAAVWGEVLLIDDVMSTGSTAEACAQALLSAGADRVSVLTLARAVLRRGVGGSTPGCRTIQVGQPDFIV
ncbi:MAG: ComF family protein [Armatimonadota bacterium]